jgi:hypothetical protein
VAALDPGDEGAALLDHIPDAATALVLGSSRCCRITGRWSRMPARLGTRPPGEPAGPRSRPTADLYTGRAPDGLPT